MLGSSPHTRRSRMNTIPIPADTTATIHHRRPVLPVLSLLVAGAAFSLAAVAIATDDAGSSTPQPSPLLTAAAVEAPSLWWADPARHPANQDPAPLSLSQAGGDGAVNTTGKAPTPWWAERR
jgi:hypothetical protein